MRTLAAALLMLCCAGAARAEGGAATIRVVIPEGYCPFNGPDAIERAMASAIRQSIELIGGAPLQAFTSCRQREAVRNMHTRFYDGYVTVAAFPEAARHYGRGPLTRAGFVRALVADADKRGWKAATERFMAWDKATDLERRGLVGVELVKPPRLLAKSAEAVFLEAIVFVYTRDKEFETPVVIGLTTAAGTPVRITASNRNVEGDYRPREAARATTEALIAANP